MPTFRPLDDQVLVRRPDRETTHGKLHVPDRAQERPLAGEVLAVGPGHLLDDGTRRPMQVRVGDQVVFRKYSGDEVRFDEAIDCLVLRETDLLGVVDP